MREDNYPLTVLACWLAVLHTAALRSIALVFCSEYFYLVSCLIAETGVRIFIILSYGAWVLIFSLGASTASGLQSLMYT